MKKLIPTTLKLRDGAIDDIKEMLMTMTDGDKEETILKICAYIRRVQEGYNLFIDHMNVQHDLIRSLEDMLDESDNKER